jgi:hypothetical protein
MVQVRPVGERDFFPWLGVFERYGERYDAPVDDLVALRVWSWLSDPGHELDGFIAIDDGGSVVGLAHARRFVRSLTATRGVSVEDLFVTGTGDDESVAAALLAAVRDAATHAGASALRFEAHPDDTTAIAAYDALATRSDRVVYEAGIR